MGNNISINVQHFFNDNDNQKDEHPNNAIARLKNGVNNE